MAAEQLRFGRDGTLTRQEVTFAAAVAETGEALTSFHAVFDPAAELSEGESAKRAANLLARDDVDLEIYVQKRLRAVTDNIEVALNKLNRARSDAALYLLMAKAHLMGIYPQNTHPLNTEEMLAWLTAQQAGEPH